MEINRLCKFNPKFWKKNDFFLKSLISGAIIHGVDDKEVSDKGFETLLKNIESGFKDEASKVKEDYHEYNN